MSEAIVTQDIDTKRLIVEYVADGPKDAVWAAYTTKEGFEQWWGPQGWETTTKEFNFSPGGRILYGMKCIDESQTDWFGQTAWGVMEIKSITPDNAFTYTDYFADEAGELNTELPALIVTNEFFDQDGLTKIVNTNQADSTEQIEQLVNMGMVEGFTSQLAKLDKLISK